jgi:hypothetical protein
MKNKKGLLLGLLIILFSLAVLHLVYSIIDKESPAALSRPSAYMSEIDTPGKKWLNGYLGVLFRFKSLGNINWLAIPLALWFFVTGKRREPWQLALVYVWLVTFLFISLKGYYNSRYQLTLFPFTAAVVLILTWELLKGKKNHWKVIVFSLLTLVCIYNIYHYFDTYSYFYDLRVSRNNPHFPSRLVNYLNRHKTIGKAQSRIFVFNQPIFYYYTDKRGIDYESPLYYEIVLGLRQKEGSRRKLYQTIRKKRRVKYVLIGWSTLNQYKERMLSEFLNCESQLVVEDNGYCLYKIRDTFLDRKLRQGEYQKVEPWNLSTLKVQGRRGDFDIRYPDKSPNKMVTVSNITPGKKGERILQLGFTGSKAAAKKIIPGGFSGRYLHFLVRVRIPRHLVNRENCIFIQDFEGTWQRQSYFFRSPYWQTYLVSRRIREDSTKIMLGIRFEPRSSQDKLMIKSIEVYTSDSPLSVNSTDR